MLEEGLAMLLTLKFPLGLDNIRIEEVIERASVPRGSAYRAWRTDEATQGPQVLFRAALADMVLAGDDADHTSNATLEVVAPILEVTGTDEFLQLSPEQRGELLIEAIRVGATANYQAVSSDPFLRVQHGLTALLRMRNEQDDSNDRQRVAIEAAGLNKIDRFKPLYFETLRLFGLRLRPGRSMDQFAYLLTALSEGLWLRPALVERFVRTDDEGREWSLSATAFVAFMRDFVENDPDRGPETAF